MSVLFQVGLIGGGDPVISWAISIGSLVLFFVFYPRIMLYQIMGKLEKSANELELLSKKSKGFLLKRISPQPSAELDATLSRFLEFFIVAPVSLDHAGIVKKFDHILTQQRHHFHEFVDQIAPRMDAEKQANLEMGLAGGITVHEIAKILRHYVEFVRKTKSFQIAYIVSMQLPLIEKIAKSMYRGTKALAKGQPVGDGLGPLVAAKLIGNAKITEIADDIVMAKVRLKNRNVIILKARGPGGRLGDPGRAVQKILATNKVARIITVDAASKLEGEKTGSIAEGVGVAMGGTGVERFMIEDSLVAKRLPIDSIVVKMSSEEAITPMKKTIKDAAPHVIEAVERISGRTKAGETILVFGVGNTSGVGNNGKAATQTEAWVEQYHQKREERKKRKRKK